MTLQPIPEGLGQQDDTFDDEKPPSLIQFGPPDLTLFEGSDVAINILLFSEDGHLQGRLVNIVVHNFGEIRAIRDYRAADLTQNSLLDNLQMGITATVQEFLFQLTDARRKTLEVQEHAKPAVPAAPLPSTSTPSNAPKKGAAKAVTVNQPSSNVLKKAVAKAATIRQLEMF